MLPNQHKLNGSCRKQNDIRRLKGGSPYGFARQGFRNARPVVGATVATMKALSEFSKTLSKARRSRKMTAKELAERTGLSSLAVRQILSGKSAPRLTNAMALAQELGLELVLVPKAVADGLRPPRKALRTVVSDVERMLGVRPEGLIQDPDEDA